MVQTPGFEPGQVAWKATILTRLDHICLSLVNLNMYLIMMFSRKPDILTTMGRISICTLILMDVLFLPFPSVDQFLDQVHGKEADDDPNERTYYDIGRIVDVQIQP